MGHPRGESDDPGERLGPRRRRSPCSPRPCRHHTPRIQCAPHAPYPSIPPASPRYPRHDPPRSRRRDAAAHEASSCGAPPSARARAPRRAPTALRRPLRRRRSRAVHAPLGTRRRAHARLPPLRGAPAARAALARARSDARLGDRAHAHTAEGAPRALVCDAPSALLWSAPLEAARCTGARGSAAIGSEWMWRELRSRVGGGRRREAEGGARWVRVASHRAWAGGGLWSRSRLSSSTFVQSIIPFWFKRCDLIVVVVYMSQIID